MTSWPPKYTTAAIESDGSEIRPGRNAASTRAWRSTPSRTAAGLLVEARLHVVLAAERLHHLDADNRLVGRLGDVRLQLLDLPRDRHHAAAEVVGQDRDERHRRSSAITASFTFTRNSTIEMPQIIISDCKPCVVPQPMK